MKNFILFLLILLGSECFAFDIVYPKKTDVTINAKSTFFIGSSKTPLKINGQEVPLHSSGGFAYVVPLKDGKNTFVIQSKDERQIFVITKPIIKSNGTISPQFIQYAQKKYFNVINERTPLRSTPVNAGINRMAHLQRNISVIVDGEKSGFYRVVLGSNLYGWIAKTDLKQCESEVQLATLQNFEQIEDENFYKFVFRFDRNVPYEMQEGQVFKLKFYNIKDCSDNVYTFEFPLKYNLIGYSGEYQGDEFILKIRKQLAVNQRKPLKNIVITIDAGHGGYENGAIGCLGDKEKDVVLAISKFLEIELKKRGAKVFMTRDDDIYVGLKDRVEKSNAQNSVIFLSIHGNALPDGLDPNKTSGASIYYYYDQAKPLAEYLLEFMINGLELCNDKVRQGSLAVVRNTNALSLLIEVAYLINPEDNSKLIDTYFQQNCAKIIADGLEEYILKSGS